MFQTGDQVVYGMHGVCRVVDEEQRLVDGKQVSYLVLEPISGQEGSKFLIPKHNEAAMAKLHPMLSKGELDQLLASGTVQQDSWIQDENRRKQTYRELISSGDRARLMHMVHSLRQHKAQQAAAGRKFHVCDENFLKDAERLLTNELSLVLEMEPKQVGPYIQHKLEEV